MCRKGVCGNCGQEFDAGSNKGPVPKRCYGCRKVSRRKAPASTHRTCVKCGESFLGRSYRTHCMPCRAAKQVACIECGEVFRKSRQGGSSKGLFCTNRCRGIHRRRANGTEARRRQRQRFSRIAQHERSAMYRKRRMRKELEKIVTFVVKRALMPCRDCGCALPLLRGYGVSGGWRLPFCETCSSQRKCVNRRRSRIVGKQRMREAGISVSPRHQSRAKRMGLPRMYGKDVSLPVIAERDGWVCQLCMEPVDTAHGRNHTRAPSIDHIVPLGHPSNRTHGHTPNNLQLAHRSCNALKQCRVACVSLFDCIDPREHVRINRIDQRVSEKIYGVPSEKNGPFCPEPHATSARVFPGFSKNREA